MSPGRAAHASWHTPRVPTTLATSLLLLSATRANAGGGPPNVVVLVNADDPEAVVTADHYATARQLPPGHVCALSGIDPHADHLDVASYTAQVQDPLDDCLAALPHPDEVDYLVVVKGLPYLVDLPLFTASLDAVLQVGHGLGPGGTEIAGSPQDDSQGVVAASVSNPTYVSGVCTDLQVTNPYASWYTAACGLAALDALPPTFQRRDDHALGAWDLGGELFAVTRLDGFDHTDARALVDRALAADGTFPDAEVGCMAAADEARGARDPECEYVARLLAADGVPAAWIAPHDPALAGHTLAALWTGTTNLQGALDGNTWVPGAVACNLTSYGAVPENFHCSADGLVCPEFESQTSIARFVRAGATAAHGTANEPLNNSFPNAGALLLYTSGYNLAESLLFAQRHLYWQNLVLGDPLVSPWATRPVVEVPAEVEAGQPVVVTATHPDGVAGLALYLEGERVAEADGDTLSWVPTGDPGDVVEVLAVATARITTVQRTGWPVAEQQVRARPQGWVTATFTLTAPPVEPAPREPEPGGCGCATGPARGSWAWVAGSLAIAGRRRRPKPPGRR